MKNLKQVTEILHTIFCRKKHEDNILIYETSDKCCYYLEQTIEDTWDQRDHKEWIEQARFFVQLSNEGGIDALDKIVTIYRCAEELRNINSLYIRYVEVLLNIKKEEKK
jgi:hypothetical protein